MRFFSASAACTLLAFLCGCAAQKPGAPARVPARAEAPALQSGGSGSVAAASNAPAPTVKEAESSPESDQALIAAARQAYDDGVTLYQAGKYPEARADFDRAFNIFLTSGRDLRNDSVLGTAFEATVDKINALELDSLQQSNGFSQQDQTPVEVANDVTFPVDPNLLAKAQAELKSTHSDLPLTVNNYVASYINYFTNTRKGHNTIENSLAREGRYHAIVEKTLMEEGLPRDLIYQAVAESGFRPRAVNPHSGAGGMWQFMPYGDYGLVRNAWVDERFDPEKATRAYARYIKELHQQFGDWYLAMAAYDWGPGKVQRAVQWTGYADFWELYQRNVLPAETKNYVPIILAAAIMAKNPSQYGLTDIPVDPPLNVDTVTTDSAINLNLVADLTGTTLDDIQQLNPALLRNSTPEGMSYDLRLPAGTATLFQQRLAMVPKDHRNSWRYHVMGQEDTLASVAQTFHVKTADLEAANQLQAGDSIHAGEALVIPVAPPRAVSRHLRYKTRRGDTIVTVADRFGVTTGELRRWNGLRSNRLRAGRMLYVSEPVRRSSHARRTTGKRPSHGTHTTAHTKRTVHSNKKKTHSSTATRSGSKHSKKKSAQSNA